jgi:hypothetical protein
VRDGEYSIGAGSRRIFTNIRDLKDFPQWSQTLPDARSAYLDYVIVGGPSTSVTAATAYGANIRTNRMILLSGNITDNLFAQ